MGAVDESGGSALREGLRAAILFGGMFSGVFTSTESAAIAAFVALLILLWEFRRAGVVLAVAAAMQLGVGGIQHAAGEDPDAAADVAIALADILPPR